METRGTVELPASPDRVFDYFADPRNLVMVNHPGPIVERSDPAMGPASWSVMAFDQIRVRVEFEAWERPERLSGVLQYTGIGSGGRKDCFDYGFRPGPSGGTVLSFTQESAGGMTLRVPFIGRLLNRRYWGRVSNELRRP